MIAPMSLPSAVATTLRVLASAAVALALIAMASAQVDISKLGPPVGARAIDFQLVDQFGGAQTLKSLAGPKGTMLVFFRSADW